ncbi:MAG TPA: TonB-dependent receptor, partial [Bryobacteraceae bacterium]|nr:TonB-dependent receptor [Bryobacteraceae bacterium]
MAPLSWSQDITKGSIGGAVKDPSGAVVSGAKVALTSPFGDKTTMSDAEGNYAFANLSVGSGYAITATHEGFAPAEKSGVVVGVNERTTVDVTLTVGSATSTVQVTETVNSGIDLATTTIGASIDESLYKNVPVGRNISSVVAMAPGVTSSGGAGASNPSINGASGLENEYIINGANVTDPGYGGFGNYNAVFGSLGQGITFDFIQEVQVKSGGFEAQYGEALGGVVNIITKGGSNKFHGDAYGYFQPDKFTADNPNPDLVTTSKTTYIKTTGRYDFGGDLGGYVKKDKLFFYAGFNPTYSQSYRQADAIYTNSALGVINVQTRTLNYAAKLNWNISSSHQLEGSVFSDPAIIPTNYVRISSLSSNNNLSTSSLDFGSRTWGSRYNGAFGPTWLLTVTYSDYTGHVSETPQFNGYQISNIAPTQEVPPGSSTTYNGLGLLQNTSSKSHQLNVIGTHLFNFFGGHTLDLGYQFEDVPYTEIDRYSGADFVLPTDPALGAGSGQTVYGAIFRRTHQVASNPASPIVLSLLRGNYSNPNIAVDTRYNAGFVEDSWTIGKKLTLK